MEDYIVEFKLLIMRCDIVELEEKTIARYLEGLRVKIEHVVQLKSYWTYNDAIKLALKVVKQLKEAHGNNY